MRNRRKRDIFLAILRASELGQGLHLTAEEVALLSLVDAIQAYAARREPERQEAADGR